MTGAGIGAAVSEQHSEYPDGAEGLFRDASQQACAFADVIFITPSSQELPAKTADIVIATTTSRWKSVTPRARRSRDFSTSFFT